MKKHQYIVPEVLITKIMAEHLLVTASNTEYTGNTEGLDDDPLENGGDDPGNFSRRRSDYDAWADDEEMDDRGSW